MMSSFGDDLIAAMSEAANHAQASARWRAHTIEVPDVRAIREELGLSQQAFASAYRIPLATLKGWEQGAAA
jgi:putative transcriptional regulator